MCNLSLPAASCANKQTVRSRAAFPTGTAVANNSYTTSCERTHGGARNCADRISEELTDQQVAGIIDASAFALATGLMFQRHWIIHYGKAGIRSDDGAQFISRVLALASKQARREGGKLTAIWVRECASDKGEHVHILLHLPAGMRLHGRTRRWIKTAGGIWRPGVSRVRIIGGRLSKVEASREARHVRNTANVIRYLLKSANREMGEQINLKRFECGGRIVGKRCGWTQNIGKSRRGIALTWRESDLLRISLRYRNYIEMGGASSK